MLKEDNSLVIFCNMHLIKHHIFFLIYKLIREYVPLFSSQKQGWRCYLKANFQNKNSRDVSSSFFPKAQTQKVLKSWITFGLLAQHSLETTIREFLSEKQAEELNLKYPASNLPSILFLMFYVLIFFVGTRIML